MSLFCILFRAALISPFSAINVLFCLLVYGLYLACSSYKNGVCPPFSRRHPIYWLLSDVFFKISLPTPYSVYICPACVRSFVTGESLLCRTCALCLYRVSSAYMPTVCRWFMPQQSVISTDNEIMSWMKTKSHEFYLILASTPFNFNV